jgi:hypothetical protein
MKYGELTLGQVEAVVNKIGGMEGVKRILSGEEVVIKRKFKTWKTIKLGTGLKTADDFRRALSDGGFRLSEWVNDILEKPAFTVATEETEVDLVKVTIAELGFKKGAQRDQIYERAEKLGLEFCSSEVGTQLRLQYKNQPNGEWIVVAMEPIIDSDSDPWLFTVERDDSRLWFSGCWGDLDRFWGPIDQWVFCRPRK